MINIYEYYELCMQGFAALKREIKEAEQYTSQLYNNQLQNNNQNEEKQTQENTDENL